MLARRRRLQARCALCGAAIYETQWRVLFDAHDAHPVCRACWPTEATDAAIQDLWTRCATRQTQPLEDAA